ncbi:hypothetical protein, unlikely [Trypanosoma brucei gambiense DAL972]|uniref:Uncharacterized protein n=1 Tax=Trypanosoma brucei gambiense (strain MHOM/CI/86/DAL972) TaxID=679716 RepID=D0A4M5_TRYB9|nr:hypothetical protein, unlikely [Trypanosoma brucei gambiense DAL972]CBH16219.1 hypothetical protein, unlikely [Trypanosoma brucei gambiense DAL972]|eukprot:XP_011778483.1 hypothetical protein, unlikely [Trypanosoma brucei gambiense DAL972]
MSMLVCRIFGSILPVKPCSPIHLGERVISFLLGVCNYSGVLRYRFWGCRGRRRILCYGSAKGVSVELQSPSEPGNEVFLCFLKVAHYYSTVKIFATRVLMKELLKGKSLATKSVHSIQAAFRTKFRKRASFILNRRFCFCFPEST